MNDEKGRYNFTGTERVRLLAYRLLPLFCGRDWSRDLVQPEDRVEYADYKLRLEI